MALSYRARRIWSYLILLVGMPAYVVAAVTVMSSLESRPPLWLEALIYVVLGLLWMVPFRAVFRGVGREDPSRVPPTE
jgi:predicted membrane channel-forming protein YqfA (hemolysin III family)